MLEERLFRREASRLIAALTRIFGLHNLELAEDVVQESFCRALEVWKVRGAPDNPSAWLMATAKNLALDRIRHRGVANAFAPELGRLLDSEWTRAAVVEEAFTAHRIRDEQLRTIFSICQPKLPEEEQLALVLNILCGFGAAEIAAALLTGRAAIEKRIARGKRHLTDAKCLLDLDPRELGSRLDTVQRALYLLFNEGYHGASASQGSVREELCAEALRLVALLREDPATATPSTNALGALMCLHAARLPARVDDTGELVALAEQDRSRWEMRLLARGLELFDESQTGSDVSSFHIEAAIAVTHASACTQDATDWSNIVALYDRLLELAPSPIVKLNRAIATARRDGAEAGLAALRTLTDDDTATLAAYPFLAAAFAELELDAGQAEAARTHFARALNVARNDAERRFFTARLQSISDAPKRDRLDLPSQKGEPWKPLPKTARRKRST